MSSFNTIFCYKQIIKYADKILQVPNHTIPRYKHRKAEYIDIVNDLISSYYYLHVSPYCCDDLNTFKTRLLKFCKWLHTYISDYHFTDVFITDDLSSMCMYAISKDEIMFNNYFGKSITIKLIDINYNKVSFKYFKSSTNFNLKYIITCKIINRAIDPNATFNDVEHMISEYYKKFITFHNKHNDNKINIKQELENIWDEMSNELNKQKQALEREKEQEKEREKERKKEQERILQQQAELEKEREKERILQQQAELEKEREKERLLQQQGEPEKESRLKCSICFEFNQNFSVLICGHTYCNECIASIISYSNNKPKCPKCRVDFCKNNIIKLFL